jgi:antibiotic biosynthesis monooxygenase (ABM) superfamily enzyme
MTHTPRKPSRLRLSLFIFLFVYPLVTLVLYTLMGLTQGWSIWQRNLVMVPIIVAAMVYIIIPFIQRRLTRWL